MATKQVKQSKKSPQKPALHSHALKSLANVSPHAHTGKKIHSKHSSHGFLLIALIFTGVLLFSNLGALKAFGLNSASGSTISVNVLGTPPTQGAEILFPETNKIATTSLLQVTGSCPSQTLVTIYNNGTFAGSTTCTTNDDFAITIQLLEGTNILQAQNYDGANQPGPATAQIIITYQPELIPQDTPGQTVTNKPSQLKSASSLPTSPPTAPQPTTNPCYDLPNTKNRSSTATPLISVSCIIRNVSVNETISMSLLVSGGTAPYALLIDWGDDGKDLISVSDNSVQNASHSYQKSGSFNIILSTTDKAGVASQIQTVVTVNGEPAIAAPTNPIDDAVKNITSVWIAAPVPLYVAAVTLVLGFWVGDIFQHFTKNQTMRKTRKRHA